MESEALVVGTALAAHVLGGCEPSPIAGRMSCATGNENPNGALAWGVEVHGIAAAKYTAAREKTLHHARDLWECGMLDPDTLDERMRTDRGSLGVSRGGVEP